MVKEPVQSDRILDLPNLKQLQTMILIYSNDKRFLFARKKMVFFLLQTFSPCFEKLSPYGWYKHRKCLVELTLGHSNVGLSHQ